MSRWALALQSKTHRSSLPLRLNPEEGRRQPFELVDWHNSLVPCFSVPGCPESSQHKNIHSRSLIGEQDRNRAAEKWAPTIYERKKDKMSGRENEEKQVGEGLRNRSPPLSSWLWFRRISSALLHIGKRACKKNLDTSSGVALGTTFHHAHIQIHNIEGGKPWETWKLWRTAHA